MKRFLVDREAGKLLLQQLIPAAQKEIQENPNLQAEIKSQLAENMKKFITMENLDTIVIYSAPLGGWHTDIILKDVPPGFPNVLGSPVKAPFKTKQAAFDGIQPILVGVLMLMREDKPETANPVFNFYDLVFTLDANAFDGLDGLLEGLPPDRFQNYASDMIDQFMVRFYPDGFKNDFETWGKEKKREFFYCIHLNVLAGVFHYPPRQHGLPSDNPTETVINNLKK